MYGHVEKLAQEIRKGAASVDGVEAKLWQVSPCLLPVYLKLSIFIITSDPRLQ